MDHHDEVMDRGHESVGTTFRAHMPRRYRIGLLLIGALATIVTVVPIITGQMELAGGVIAVLLAAVFIAISLMHVAVRLNGNDLGIRVAGVFATTISYRDISDVAPANETGIAEGMGLRILPNSTTGYLVGGPTVRITTGRSAVLVSSATPEKLVEAIEHRRIHPVP